MSGPRLHPDDLAALADLVADRLAERLISADGRPSLGVRSGEAVAHPEMSRERPGALLSAREVAARFGVSADWVREHQTELGVVRLGDGPRPRLRFDPVRVAEAMTARAESEGSEAEETRVAAVDLPSRRRSRSGDALDSLPVRELQPRPIPISGPGDAPTSRGLATRRTPSPRRERTPTSGTSSRASAHACSSEEDA